MVDAYRPQSLREAFAVRARTHAVPFSGGTDLMVRYRNRAGVLPEFPWPVLYLNHLEELKGIIAGQKQLVIKAGTTLTDIEQEPFVPTLLRRAVSQMAAPALRNLGTLAGNVCNASPAGDALCALYALEADVELSSSKGSRVIPVSDFVLGPGKTALADDEILTAVRLDRRSFNMVFYRKVGTRKANALSKLSVCGLAALRNGRIDDFRIAFGAVGPTVVRSRETEKLIIGSSAEDVRTQLASWKADYDACITPIDDQRSTAGYRKEVALRLFVQCMEHIEQELAT